MSEKVLGFYKKDADYGKVCKTCRVGIEADDIPEDGFCSECGCGEGFEDVFIIDKNEFVPVVSVEWLEKWCKENKAITEMSPKEWVCVKYLLSAVRKQSKAVKK